MTFPFLRKPNSKESVQENLIYPLNLSQNFLNSYLHRVYLRTRFETLYQTGMGLE